MADHPILFSGPMVRTLLAGTKTQTRRAACIENTMGRDSILAPRRGREAAATYLLPENAAQAIGCCPYGQPGDRLWVRETWMSMVGTGVEKRDPRTGERTDYAYAADHPAGSYGDECRKEFGLKWKPSIHMPRAACRLMLEITGVRVERLQDISYEDAIAEGIMDPAKAADFPAGLGRDETVEQYARRTQWPQRSFRTLWEGINGPASWSANPWVWVVGFKMARLDGEGGAA